MKIVGVTYDNGETTEIQVITPDCGRETFVKPIFCENCEHYDGDFCLMWDKVSNNLGYCYLAVRKDENEQIY